MAKAKDGAGNTGEGAEGNREERAPSTSGHAEKKSRARKTKARTPLMPTRSEQKATKAGLSPADRAALKEKAAELLPPPVAAPGMKPTTEERKREDAKRRMLAALMTPGVWTVRQAAVAAAIDFSTHYGWAREDERYAAAVKDAIEVQTQYLEEAAHRRAYGEGMKQPSDLLAIFLLKGRRPDTYRDNAKVEHGGTNGGPMVVQVVSYADPKAAPPKPAQKKEGA